MKFEFKDRWTGEVIISVEAKSLKLALEIAVKKANLREANLSEADLSGANLREANLSWADLSRANLREANLREANLSGADLSRANLREANLREANLSWADLSGANLREANLSRTNLREADLSWADLGEANLREANLREAILSEADLSEADLSGANLSEAENYFNSIDYLKKNFEFTQKGVIVYKSFGLYRSPNSNWRIRKNAILKENCNPLPTLKCACGVNVSTLDWIKGQDANEIWRAIVEWEWACDIVVPYNTDGKIRCSRIRLLEKLKKSEVKS